MLLINDVPTLVEVLRRRAALEGEHPAYLWLKDGRIVDRVLTYAEVEHEARRIAGALRSRIEPGQRALLLYGGGLEFVVAFWACLFAGVVAVPAPGLEAVRAKQSVARLKALIKDADIEWILTTTDGVERLRAVVREADDHLHVQWIDTTAIPGEEAWHVASSLPQSHEVAYLQYTSGSTSAPRGVIVPHGTLLAHCRSMLASIPWDPLSRSLCWMPHFHDYGLVHGILAPVYGGLPAYLMAPVSFVRSPLRWIEAISRYRISHSGAPNFAYAQCARMAQNTDLSALDLSCWKVASCGAEPIRAESARAFIDAFGSAGFTADAFMPAYGEVDVTELEAGRVVLGQGDRHRTLVSCGEPIADAKVAIVDPTNGNRCDPNQVGEIWVAGPSVAGGYWNKQAETEAIFGARLLGEPQPYLRTGDLGFIWRGQLFITGRRKDLIIIDGRNHAPQDIEESAEASHPALQGGTAAAFSVTENSGEQLVIVHEVPRGTEAIAS